MTWLLPELRELLGASFVGAYQPAATDRGWSLESMHGAGNDAHLRIRAFHRFVDQIPAADRFLAYNPYRVEIEQRNHPVLTSYFPRAVVAEWQDRLFQAVGVSGQDQLRVLLCDGPRLLSWLGATRPEPFTAREAGVLRHLTAPLRRRLSLERQLRPSWSRGAAVDVALEALNRPAFVVGPRFVVEVANSLGRALLERDAKGLREAIRESERCPASGPYSITRLTVPGHPVCLLAIEKDQRASIANLVAIAQGRWGLTACQTRVLELLVMGESNKEIAHRLSCATVTVENHVAGLYRRSGARSRADLVRRFFWP